MKNCNHVQGQKNLLEQRKNCEHYICLIKTQSHRWCSVNYFLPILALFASNMLFKISLLTTKKYFLQKRSKHVLLNLNFLKQRLQVYSNGLEAAFSCPTPSHTPLCRVNPYLLENEFPHEHLCSSRMSLLWSAGSKVSSMSLSCLCKQESCCWECISSLDPSNWLDGACITEYLGGICWLLPWLSSPATVELAGQSTNSTKKQ